MVDQHIQALRRLSGIAVDAGDHDGTGIAEKSTTFAAMLKAYGIPVTFEVYPGTHTSGIAERFEKKVLPFFWQRLRNVQTSVRE